MSRLHQKATHQQTRLYNRKLVLRTIFDAGSISRADIARATQLTPVTVSEIVAQLIAEKLAVEVEPSLTTAANVDVPARRGGRRFLFRLQLANATSLPCAWPCTNAAAPSSISTASFCTARRSRSVPCVVTKRWRQLSTSSPNWLRAR